jgi:hypothetical protein
MSERIVDMGAMIVTDPEVSKWQHFKHKPWIGTPFSMHAVLWRPRAVVYRHMEAC